MSPCRARVNAIRRAPGAEIQNPGHHAVGEREENVGPRNIDDPPTEHRDRGRVEVDRHIVLSQSSEYELGERPGDRKGLEFQIHGDFGSQREVLHDLASVTRGEFPYANGVPLDDDVLGMAR